MPTLNLQVAAGADDADELDDGTGFDGVDTEVNCRANSTASSRSNGGFRFTGVTIPQGTTILAATLEVVPIDATNDNPNVDISAEDVDNAVSFVTTADVTSRVRTTATVTWAEDNIPSPDTSPDITAVIQEVIDRAGWVSGNALVVFMDGRSDLSRQFRVASFEHATLAAVKLDITYGSPQTVTPSPLAIPIVFPTPTVVSLRTATPTPVTLPIAFPVPILALSTVTPSPVTVPIVLPAVGLVSVLLSPDPLVIPIAFPAPTIGGVRIMSPSPIAVPIVLPTPGVGVDTPLKHRHRAVITTPAGTPVGQIIG